MRTIIVWSGTPCRSWSGRTRPRRRSPRRRSRRTSSMPRTTRQVGVIVGRGYVSEIVKDIFSWGYFSIWLYFKTRKLFRITRRQPDEHGLRPDYGDGHRHPRREHRQVQPGQEERDGWPPHQHDIELILTFGWILFKYFNSITTDWCLWYE